MMHVFAIGLFASVLFCLLSIDVGLLEFELTDTQTAAPLRGSSLVVR